MTSEQNFEQIVAGILNRHPNSPLAERWGEARASDPSPVPIAFWIRESEDLVNVVWLTQQDIRDITWLPGYDLSTFHLLRLSAITSLETRQAPEAAQSLGYASVSGDYLTYVHTPSERGGLVWIASKDAENIARLRNFVSEVVKRIP